MDILYHLYHNWSCDREITDEHDFVCPYFTFALLACVFRHDLVKITSKNHHSMASLHLNLHTQLNCDLDLSSLNHDCCAKYLQEISKKCAFTLSEINLPFASVKFFTNSSILYFRSIVTIFSYS